MSEIFSNRELTFVLILGLLLLLSGLVFMFLFLKGYSLKGTARPGSPAKIYKNKKYINPRDRLYLLSTALLMILLGLGGVFWRFIK